MFSASRTSIPTEPRRLVKSARNVSRLNRRQDFSARMITQRRQTTSQYPLTTAKKQNVGKRGTGHDISGRLTADHRDQVEIAHPNMHSATRDIFDQAVALSSVEGSSTGNYLKNSVRKRLIHNSDIDGVIRNDYEAKAYPREHW